MYVLKDSRRSLVTLEDNGLVRKVTRIPRHSGSRTVSATEVVEREVTALQRLVNVPNVQRFVARDFPNSFFSEYMPGKRLIDGDSGVGNNYFDRID